MAALDYKKTDKDLYLPPTHSVVVEVPCLPLLMVDGEGAPDGAAYQNAVGALYTVLYTIKMSKKGNEIPSGYFDFTVPPLEGLWDAVPGEVAREDWTWTSMLRVPEYVTAEVLAWALERAKRKKPELQFEGVRLERVREGLCVQMMHIGPYAAEVETLRQMTEFMAQNGLRDDTGAQRRHHELYITNPQRTAPEKMRTVVRHPVVRL